MCIKNISIIIMMHDVEVINDNTKCPVFQNTECVVAS